jgi:YgiT-type zinc finger domain-containing protein
MDKCPRCGAEMKIEQDAYVRDDTIVLHEVEKCPECGEIILTEEQMDTFVEKLKLLNLWEGEYGIVKLRRNLPENEKLVEVSKMLEKEGVKLKIIKM